MFGFLSSIIHTCLPILLDLSGIYAIIVVLFIVHLMDTNQLLQQIGLSFKEAELYLSSLELGPSTVLGLSKATTIHRTLVYQKLESLIQKGLFSTVIQGKRKLYQAVDPDELLQYLKDRERELKEALPYLKAEMHRGADRPRLLFYEGTEQLRTLFRTGLQAQKKEMYSYFPSRYMAELFGKREMEDIIGERIKKKIFAKTLRGQTTEVDFVTFADEDKAYRETRILPEGKDPQMGLVIFDDTVNLFSPTDENYGIQIKSRSYANLMRTMFESLWEKSLP